MRSPSETNYYPRYIIIFGGCLKMLNITSPRSMTQRLKLIIIIVLYLNIYIYVCIRNIILVGTDQRHITEISNT